ncbi:MAG TPA: hypothetical protein VIH57_08835, partial [Bacteroidales bacterium]
MKYKGINYDIGTYFNKEHSSRELFDMDIVRQEIGIIKNELKCNAIRISGQETDRLFKASEIALELGLTVFFSPAKVDATMSETLEYLSLCSASAEKLRTKYGKVIFVVGCEFSIFTKGFIKGEGIYQRIKNLFGPLFLIKSILKIKNRYNYKLNAFLAEAVKIVKENFTGEITYASGTWEDVDWTPFDIVSADHYRGSYNKSFYTKQLRNYLRFGKPMVITEFGCCTYQGAEDKGGAGWAIIDWSKPRPELKKNYIRNEDVQANYIVDLLGIFEEEKIEGAFVFTFVNTSFAFNPDPKYDLDMASYGIVKTIKKPGEESYKGLPWVPKKSFYQLAEY